MQFKTRSAGVSDVGTVREINEDSFLDFGSRGLWVVADGMGGHDAGDVASGMIVETLKEIGDYSCLSEFVDDVESRLLSVNDELVAMSAENGEQTVMGSTVAVLLCYHHQGALLWAGDSRVYRLRGGTVRQLTRDHSEVEEMIASGEIERAQAENHPSANVITRAVGVLDGAPIDMKFQDLRDGDRFLLCSDGLYRVLNEDDFAQYMGERDLRRACRDLVDLALERGTRDNVTVVLVEFVADAR